MKALFEVGEEVILVSKDCPELNGDAVVVYIAPFGVFNCPHCGRKIRRNEELTAYYLNVTSVVNQKCCSAWSESCLRKKHKGSDFSFDEMIKEIKSKKPI